MRRSLTAVLALSVCSASALAADTLRIDIKGLDGDLAANARAWVEPLEKSGYTDTPAARMNVDKTVRLSLRALGYYQPAVSMTVRTSAVSRSRSFRASRSHFRRRRARHGSGRRRARLQVSSEAPRPQEGRRAQPRQVRGVQELLTNAALQLGYFDAEFVKSQLGVSIPFARPSGPSTTRPASAGASAT